jgi:hypothetical protein
MLDMPVPRLTLRNVGILAIIGFVGSGEYVIWLKSPIAEVAAICDKFRNLREAGLMRFHVVEEASAADYEPYRLIDQAVRACHGEAIDVEDSSLR